MNYADPRDATYIASANQPHAAALASDYAALGAQLERRGIRIDDITRAVANFKVAIPSWGVGTGGTRFGRFPGVGEPRNVFEKLEDCAVIHKLTAATPTVSLHLPWDRTDDYKGLREHGAALGLAFDAMNSNTFQDQPGQPLSYKYGSLTHTDAAVRAQAVAHNIDCIKAGVLLGSRALTVWIGDGANFPGQSHLGRAYERYLESTKTIYAALPGDWRMFIEHKMYEPSFYATVIQDWGSSLMAAQTLGPKAFCLVDLGHHAPNVNIEMIVARLVHAHMLDQSHNVTDPVESLMTSAIELQRAYAQALIVERKALHEYRLGNDVLMAAQTLKRGFTTDVSPILAQARASKGAAIDPVGAYRKSGYRAKCGEMRPGKQSLGGGIV
jgi:L-rhamnose isomerase/sugar isomerase